MSRGTAARRALLLAAIGLAIADAALFAAWSNRAHTAPPSPGAAGTAAASHGVTPATAGPDGAAAQFAAGEAGASHATSASAAAPDATAIVFGSVRTADGAPVAKGNLSLQGDTLVSPSAAITDGAFVLAGVRPGTYVLRSRVEDQLPLDRIVDVEAPRTRLDLQLDAAWMLAVNAVTPDGEPLVQATAAANEGYRWFRGLTALAYSSPLAGDLPPSNAGEVSGGLGSFRGGDLWRPEAPLQKHTIGLLALPADRPVHVALLARNVLLAQQPASPGQKELTFTLSPRDVLARTGTVRARVIDEAGKPVPDARVNVNDSGSSGGGEFVDAQGRVTLRHVKPGLLDVDVTHKALLVSPARVVIAPGVETDLGDLVLRPAVVVELAFEGGSAATVVRATPLDPPARPEWRPDVLTRVAPRPSLTLRLSAGRHALYAVQDDLCALLEVDTQALPPQPMRVALRRGAPLTVKWRMGERSGRAVVRAPRGAVVFEFELAGSQQLATPVPPGTYDVEFVQTGALAERRTVVVGASGAVLELP